ncbi:MAG: SH3 domain-containing protein [Thermomicrobiales bacterium]
MASPCVRPSVPAHILSSRPHPPSVRSFGSNSPNSTRRTALRTLLGLALLLASPALPALAAPKAPETVESARAISLGDGTYEMVATAFGSTVDGLIGNETSSGHILRANDRLVALPACTESSCPWLDRNAGVGDSWGPQTLCAESDGYCWVAVESVETGRCAVAPVLDVGPLFIHDNWWAAKSQRTYRFDQGVPAASWAGDGYDFGFGPGISDRGHDVRNDWTHGAAIDLAAGSWVDLGLPLVEGVADVRVTLLWQAGISHHDACGGGGGGNATVNDSLNLRGGPSTGEGVLDVMPAGSRVTILGGSINGFFPVRYGTTPGWAFRDFLDADVGASRLGVILEDLNLRSGPSTSDGVIDVMPAGRLIGLGDVARNGFVSVSSGGAEGWAYAAYVDAGDAGFDRGSTNGVGGGDTATVTEALNLRSGPSTGDDVLDVMSAGATVTLTGDRANGFVAVRFGGQAGWAFAEYLDGGVGGESTTVAEDLNLRAGPGTGEDVLDVMPAGAEVILTGESSRGFVSVSYDGQEGWAAAAYLTSGGGALPSAVRTVAEDLNLRTGPSTGDRVIRVMPTGDRVVLTGQQENGFVSVLHDGREGWAYAEYLE